MERLLPPLLLRRASPFFLIRRSDKKFASYDCFAAHEPNPAGKSTKKLAYTLPGRDSDVCGVVLYDELFTVILSSIQSCGTKRYCQAFDTERELAIGTYKNAVECFKAHDHEAADNTETK
ncbi:hypothetical protein G6O67_004489 [Ophiocordyceps sinensis]|uniref:Uncharacterized protein n=2 Tax=Ophiocordyceps sinensis TaxID=72228 RepID=A0A8H4PPJ1_9HYPO|nr:hypothetical protein OCS_02894 [Ophiocordyceps sinensis CO18]KAF4508057.1 hypothetical protein G6O67_004489 [Ophiocordyceps sinensis]